MRDTKVTRITLEDACDFLDYREGSGGTVEIFDIVVGSERGIGRGRRLVQLLIDRVKDQSKLVFAITRNSNAIARLFYRKIGFRRIGTLRSFYPDTGEDAVMYGRDI